MIDHGYVVSSSFVQLSRIDVKVGDRVTQGQMIAAGGATGPHLHWGMNWFVTRIDPLLALERKQRPCGLVAGQRPALPGCFAAWKQGTLHARPR